MSIYDVHVYRCGLAKDASIVLNQTILHAGRIYDSGWSGL